MEEKLRCSTCQYDNDPDARFCERCRTRLGPTSCPGCGRGVDADARFCAGCGAALSAASEPARRVPLDHGTQTRAGERRQLTVLFSDLVDSTALSGRLDPEELRDIVARYHRDAAEAVQRHGGYVAKYLGDGVLALFGYPQAGEEDAEHAVRAGLAIVDAVRSLDTPEGLRVRVGLHTGPVVVGAGAGDVVDVFGETPNVAARVQSAAEPGTVLMSAATHRLVAGLFVVTERGPQELKGVREPMALYRVVQPSGVRGRLAAQAMRGLTPLFGRQRETEALVQLWEQTRRGAGQVALVVGEAGIGKSRLVQTLKQTLADQPHTWVECAASPRFTNTPFYAVTEMLRQALGWRADEPATECAGRLAQSLAAAQLDVNETLPLIAPWLNLPVPDHYPRLRLSADGQRKQTFVTMLAWLLGLARAKPLAAVVEDVHWADPSTLELQALLVERCAAAPVLLIYTARPQFRAPWPAAAHHTQLDLARLDARYVRDIVPLIAAQSGAGSATLSVATIEAIVGRSEGVPLFAEELTRAVMEGGSATGAIPATLHDSLMARLDRLGPAKEVAQIAAVVGREFAYDLLRTVTPFSEPELQAALGRLVEAQLISPPGRLGESGYLFKHALVQDAAYEALLKSRRRELHGRVAKALLESFPAVAAARPELVAHHLEQAGDAEAAARRWQHAGRQATDRSAYAEAAGHYRHARDLLGSLEPTLERAGRSLRLQLGLALALMANRGYSAPETVEAFEQARQLAAGAGNPQQAFVGLLGICTATLAQGQVRRALALADQLLAMAGDDPLRLAWAHHDRGQALHYAGELEAARLHLERAISFQIPSDRRNVSDPGVWSRSFAALTAWHLGFPDQAARLMQELLGSVDQFEGAHDRATAYWFNVQLGVMRRDPRAVLDAVSPVLRLATEHDLALYLTLAHLGRGWARALSGDAAEGLQELRDGLRYFSEAGHQIELDLRRSWLADACLLHGNIAEARAAIDEACTVPDADISVYRPEVLRLHALVRQAEGAGCDEIEAAYREALTLAEQQSNRGYGIRVATTFARWLRDHGRAAEGRELLAPLYRAFTEGWDTADLREAGTYLS